jgi:thiamine pyrophosphokinase
VVAADAGLGACEQAGVEAAWVIGDMDSLDDERRLDRYAGRIVRHRPDKDYTDTELALVFLREHGAGGIWIIGGGGGRTDHLLALAALFERREKPERWITGREDIRFLGAGTERFFPLTRPGCPVSVFPLGEPPWEAESRFLRWPLTGLAWNRGFFSISNELAEGNTAGGFYLRAIRGGFLVLTPFPGYSF